MNTSNPFDKFEEELLIRNSQQEEKDLRANFWWRLLAWFIDFVIIFFVTFFLMKFINPDNELIQNMKIIDFEMSNSERLTLVMYQLQVSLIVTVLYALMDILLAFTPGKIVLGLKIANEDGTIAPLSKLAYRKGLLLIIESVALIPLIAPETLNISQILSTVLMLVFIISCLFALGDKKQTLHDMIAKTAVFKIRNIKEVENNV
jgi:uncharacterized RDD family membrane protein YckC